MKYVLFLTLVLLSSCGNLTVETEVEGEVNHKFEIDLQQLEIYFTSLCEQQAPDNVNECVNIKVAEFLEFLMDE
jgi:hypothetical protein